ncbi:STAS domain-containing protein [Actinoplanes sp. CA-030573]|uniref:STAS domain-containing protein n=1 Tax=Actinoplanes sp. CA-030573 TaxID=3239898 RepID=UPI003D8BDD4A
MNITSHRDGDGVVRLAMTGDLDMATTGLLQRRVATTLEKDRPKRLVIDVAGVTFCDSSGIHAFLLAREAANRQGVAFLLANPSGITRRTLEITGLLERLTTP